MLTFFPAILVDEYEVPDAPPPAAIIEEETPAPESVPIPPAAQRERSVSPNSIPPPHRKDSIPIHSSRMIGKQPTPAEATVAPDYDSDATEPEDDEEEDGVAVPQRAGPSRPVNKGIGQASTENVVASPPAENVDSDVTVDEDDEDEVSDVRTRAPLDPAYRILRGGDRHDMEAAVPSTNVLPSPDPVNTASDESMDLDREPESLINIDDHRETLQGLRTATTARTGAPSSGKATKRKATAMEERVEEGFPRGAVSDGRQVQKKPALGTGIGSTTGVISGSKGKKKKSVW